MRFFIDDIEIFFPYSYIYPEQYNYMTKLKQSLDVGGPCMLEMPSGTGKTVSLLSLILSYQLHWNFSKITKFIYCSRTLPEIEKVLEESRRVIAYIQTESINQPQLKSLISSVLCIGLTSRSNLCIHPRISQEKNPRKVDSDCRNLTAEWARSSNKEKCSYYETFLDKVLNSTLPVGVYSIEDLIALGKKNGWCPYFFARHCINFAQIVVFSYQYIIDPKITQLVTKEFKNNSVVVFDEAHNIDNVCIDALSININRQTLEACSRNINTLTETLKKARITDAEKLKKEYLNLIEGLAQNNINFKNYADQIKADPVLPKDVIQEVVPGNIRKGEHFLALIKRLNEYLKFRLKINQVISESPLAFLQNLYQTTQIEPKTLKFCSSRLMSLLYTLELPDIFEFTPISIVADFGTLVGTYSKGFKIFIDPYDSQYTNPNEVEPVLQFCCLDASLAMKPVLGRYYCVVITSGTISPLDMYACILDFQPKVIERFSMTLTRNCICPMIVTRGSDQIVISSKFSVRNDPIVVRNYGTLIEEIAAVVPDGIVCFFPSYTYMEETITTWNEMGILNQILPHKLLFVETPDASETSLALFNYKRACDSGRGAVLFSVARGKVSEGIDFAHHYGRCVILFGIPYLNTENIILKARLEFLRLQYQIRENEFLSFDAMRTAAQCVGRVIRGKTDYGIMIFADKRYARSDKYSKLPAWISSYLTPTNMNLSVDMAVTIASNFLKQLAQPWKKEEQLGKSLWSIEHIKKIQQQQQQQQQ